MPVIAKRAAHIWLYYCFQCARSKAGGQDNEDAVTAATADDDDNSVTRLVNAFSREQHVHAYVRAQFIHRNTFIRPSHIARGMQPEPR